MRFGDFLISDFGTKIAAKGKPIRHSTV